MKRKNVTRNALFTSIIAMLLCVSMLVGTTFAWFTDSVTSAGNKVVAGNLDVDLYQWTADGSAEITNESDPLFGNENSLVAQNDATNTLWEPGKTQVVYLSIKNNGSLDLKYKVNVNVKNPIGGKDLYKAMQYAITPDAQFGSVDAWTNGKSVVVGSNETDYNDVMLKAGEEHFFALSVHMMEEAGNEYQNGTVEFDVSVLAGQLASELDSFGNTYDAMAAYPGTGFAALPVAGQSAVEVDVKDTKEQKVGSVVIPAAAIADDAEGIKVVVDESSYEGNFTIGDDKETKVLDVKVEGLKEGNTTPVKVTLYAPVGLNPATVELFHYDNKIDCSYDPYTGYVTFESATFSPFTIVYDAESTYVPPVVDEETVFPTNIVVRDTTLENIPLEWGSYGQWSPTEGLDSKLEGAFVFTCPNNAEFSETFANWYCDFYVMLDKDLGENQLFLGGNYGDFGWIGFHNGTLTQPANTELGLLESVTTNPWTYKDVEDFVGEFTCGVGDVNDALNGATFTVKLRLTNPEDATEFYDVVTVNYTFGANTATFTYYGQ